MVLSKNSLVLALALLSFSFLAPDSASAFDVLNSSTSIKDPEAIVSAGNKFRLGFFSPVNSSFRYVGIWNSDAPATREVVWLVNSGAPAIREPVWVANRDSPINDSSGVMRISDDGNLIVSNGHGEIIWSTNVSSGVSNSSAQLQDDGNLVLRSNINGSIISLWESFQQPCDTSMPHVVLSTNARTGAMIKLTSWKSPSDPSVGSFSVVIDPDDIPQLKVLKGNQTYWRSGPWDGNSWLGIPGMENVSLYGFTLGRDDDGSINFQFAKASTILINYHISFDGIFRELNGYYAKGTWYTSWMVPKTDCDLYGKCGEFGICNPLKPPICSCLQGFKPKKKEEWKSGNWTNGCVRKSVLQCERAETTGGRAQNGTEVGKTDGFLKMQMVKPPDYTELSPASTEQSCRAVCLSNCSCIAYAYMDGFGCMLWRKNLVDIQQFPSGPVNLNLRLAYSELDGGRRRNFNLIISLSVSLGAVAIVMCVVFLRCLAAKHTVGKGGQNLLSNGNLDDSPFWEENKAGYNLRPGRLQEVPLFNLQNQKDLGARSRIELQELPVFSLQKLATATDNFALTNKLGQGGFGPVYKGQLPDRQEIAVKRLSRASGQGVEEFMNEVLVISKLQHRNLVRLLGCCVEGEEKMLVYEYMPNKSLDSFLFDPIRKNVLDWRKRSNIIEGICRGLLYLHRDSRLRIIHRDLKAGNILLDQEMNPKISDFGMARIFGGNEDQADTNRVVGTYGYMSPEYAMEGRFSEKSDVFSFGVLLLEIVCGRRNSSFYNDSEMSLLGLAWKLWIESKMSSLVDPILSDECFEDDILRCIHVGLLCVQESANDRPAVSTVISMLNSEIVDLPSPKQPAYIGKMNGSNTESIPRASMTDSAGTVTITELEGR